MIKCTDSVSNFLTVDVYILCHMQLNEQKMSMCPNAPHVLSISLERSKYLTFDKEESRASLLVVYIDSFHDQCGQTSVIFAMFFHFSLSAE